MNRAIRIISVGFLILFLLLLGNANYVQVFQADRLNNGPQNSRTLYDEYKKERGPVLVGGDPIAWSKKGSGKLLYERKYSDDAKNYAALLGYFSITYGRTGIEREYNDILNGTDDRLFVRRVIDMLSDKPPKGGSVQLTLNRKAQQAAVEGLGNRKGAVVALEPDTGRVLAMANSPTYDPTGLASEDHDTAVAAWEKYAESKKIEENDRRQKVNKQREKQGKDPLPMLKLDNYMENRGAGHRYPPGSTFKLVTAAAALESGKYDEDTTVDSPSSVQLPLSQNSINNEWGGACGDGSSTLEYSLEVSCNTAFANIGVDLGDDKLREQAEKFGFAGSRDQLDDGDKNPLSAYGGASSMFPPNEDADGNEMDKAQTMLSSIGQYDVQSTPLQMAMVSAGIANDGEVMKPYVVEQLRAPDTKVLSRTQPEQISRAMSGTNADKLTDMMVNVVDEGTGESAQIDGMDVAGKTGTAQTTPDQPPYAWFTSFAPAEDPQVAVAVVIEEADVARSEISGGGLAGPIAKDVMEAVNEQN